MTTNRFALELQRLASVQDKVLVAGDLLRRRSSDSRFTAREVTELMMGLDVPPPGNVPRTLSALGTARKALRHADGRWALTPLGIEAAGDLAIRLPDSAEAPPEAAQFAHVDHTVIPHWAAPPRWAAGIARLVEQHPFDDNVFCMTRFPSEGGVSDPVAAAINTARETLAEFGLMLHVATDSIVDDDLLGNVGAYMWGCRYGLGFLEDRVERGLNYNAVIELGGMALTGRRCAILKDRTAPPLPTDLSGQIYQNVDLDVLSTVAEAVRKWAESDLHR